MSVRTYKLSLNGDEHISPSFKVKEFRCKDGSDTILIDVDFVIDYLQKIREHFGMPVTILSGYRTESYNRKVNGALNSYHLKGMAFDIQIEGIIPHHVSLYSESLGIRGIIEYNSFTHIDSRAIRYWARDDNGRITIKRSFV